MTEGELLEVIRDVIDVDEDGIVELDHDGHSKGFGNRGSLPDRLVRLRTAVNRAITEGVE